MEKKNTIQREIKLTTKSKMVDLIKQKILLVEVLILFVRARLSKKPIMIGQSEINFVNPVISESQ